jgi:hypothetical protein
MGGKAGAVGGITNGIIGGQAAVTAGNDETGAYSSGMKQIQENYNANSPNYQPFIQNGIAANNQLSQGLGPNGALGRQFTQSDFQQSPAYAFNMQQGLNAINNSQSVRGGALSGGAQKAASGYAQQNASNQYQNSYNQFVQNQNQNYQQLSGASQQGLMATQGLGALGAGESAAMNQDIVSQGNASAQEALGKAAAFEGGVNSSMDALGSQQTSGYSGSGMQQIMGLFNS